MPILLPAQEIRVGDRLAEPFVHQKRSMLPAGRALTEDQVQTLHRRYADEILRVQTPILDQVVRFEDDTDARSVGLRIQQQIVDLMHGWPHELKNASAVNKLDFNAIRQKVEQLVQDVIDSPMSTVLLAPKNNPKDYLLEHTGNVFFLSMALALAARGYVSSERARQTSVKVNADRLAKQDMIPLGLGVLFMDLGMFALQELIRKEGHLAEKEHQQILEHPVKGSDLLPSRFPVTAKMIVRTHHENLDGTGYPNMLAGDQLHIFSRIVRIADAFDAATATQVYKSARSPAAALWEMTVGPYKGLYDPILLKVLGTLIQPFSIGTKLTLADGRQAVVVRYNRATPLRPWVFIAFDSEGKHLPKSAMDQPVELASQPHLQPVSCWGENVQYLYAPDHNQPDSVENEVVELGGFTTPFEAAYP